MNRIFTELRAWLDALVARPGTPDPLESLSPRERADLPAMHPPAGA
jgi:hypothetical protein